jgi:hypothetical protein
MMTNLLLKNITSSKRDFDVYNKVFMTYKEVKIRSISVLNNLIFIFFKRIEESAEFNEKYYL